MPGYDKNRFINLKEQEELMCGICHGIFIEPKVTPCCRQTYCADCIEQCLQEKSSCPNDRQELHVKNLFPAPRIIYNMLNKLLMKCEFDKNGCKENFLLENIKVHTKECTYNPNNTCIDCDHLIGNRRSHNCIKNLKFDNKNLKEGNKVIEHKLHFLERTLNSVNEKCKEYLKQLNDLKEKNSKNEKQIEFITEENITLNINNNGLVLKNKKLKELSSELYNKLKSVESDMVPLPIDNDSDLNNLLNTFEKFINRQLNSDTQRNNIVDKLSKFNSNIENDNFFKEIYNVTKVNEAPNVDLINFRRIHRYVTCDGCKVDPIVGIRNKCNECEDYNLCEICIENSGVIHSPLHIFREVDTFSNNNNETATIRFKIDEINTLKSTIISPPTFVRNLPWKIELKPYTEGTQDNETTTGLGFYVACNSESDSKTWSCNASADLRIISQKEGIENFSKKIEHKFCYEDNNWGYHKFIGWKYIIDPVKGYIKDDAIILEVVIFADEPEGI